MTRPDAVRLFKATEKSHALDILGGCGDSTPTIFLILLLYPTPIKEEVGVGTNQNGLCDSPLLWGTILHTKVGVFVTPSGPKYLQHFV